MIGKWPALSIQKDASKFPFPQDNELTAESVSTFLAGFESGTLEPTYKSEAIPTENDGPVRIIVGKSFNSIVLDAKKDVFVEFYAPWCGYWNI